MMNHIVPDFEMDEDSSMPSPSSFFQQKKQTMAEDDLVELLWRNGQVVMQNQNQRPHKKSPTPPPPPPPPPIGDAVLPPPPEKSAAAAAEIGPSTAATQLFMQEDEMASWLHYPLDDSFDRDFCAELLYSAQLGTGQVAADRNTEGKPVASSSRPPIPPPARRGGHDHPPNPKLVHFGHFSCWENREGPRPSASDKIAMESTVVDSSVTPTLGPSSSRVRVSAGERTTTGSGIGNLGAASTSGGGSERELVTGETTMTSSSGGSGASPDTFAKPTAGVEDRKRKARDTDDLEGLSEEADYESVEEKKPIRRPTSARRTRAAEVHNLSERRRRDRINEKMKALQELIPRCNKTDKASMLDEAIEYLKSLQLQVQMMSMGCSMGPMMFPGIPQYMPPMGMGMGMGMNVGMGMGMGMGMDMNRAMLPFPPVIPTTLPSSATSHMGPRLPLPPFHIPHVPPSDQSKAQPTSHVDPPGNLVNAQGPSPAHMLNPADPYQHYLGLHHMQVPPQNQGATQPPCTPKEAETPESHKSG